MWGWFEPWCRARIERVCGTGAAHQWQFYRCVACHHLLTWRHIRQGGCRCGGIHMAPAILSRREKFTAIVWPGLFVRDLY